MELLLRIRWRPEIGDPSAMGWFTVFAYAIAAILAWRTWMSPPRDSREKLWLGTALLVSFLCLNKQFDLQSLFTDIGREVARHGDWYDRRRDFQKWFVLGVLGGAVLFGSWVVWEFHAFLLGHKILTSGLFFLLTFIVVRAISFHHVDVFLKSDIAGVKMNWALELSGIFLIGLAAWRESQRGFTRISSASEN